MLCRFVNAGGVVNDFSSHTYHVSIYHYSSTANFSNAFHNVTSSNVVHHPITIAIWSPVLGLTMNITIALSSSTLQYAIVKPPQMRFLSSSLIFWIQIPFSWVYSSILSVSFDHNIIHFERSPLFLAYPIPLRCDLLRHPSSRHSSVAPCLPAVNVQQRFYIYLKATFLLVTCAPPCNRNHKMVMQFNITFGSCSLLLYSIKSHSLSVLHNQHFQILV